jgi:hypothetical protein
MKNKIFAFLLLAIFSFAVRPIHPPQSQTLSSKEMSSITGGDPCIDAVIATVALAAAFASGQWWAIFVAVYNWQKATAACQDQQNHNVQGGTGGDNGRGDSQCEDSGGYCNGANENIYGSPCSSDGCGRGYCCHD